MAKSLNRPQKGLATTPRKLAGASRRDGGSSGSEPCFQYPGNWQDAPVGRTCGSGSRRSPRKDPAPLAPRPLCGGLPRQMRGRVSTHTTGVALKSGLRVTHASCRRHERYGTGWGCPPEYEALSSTLRARRDRTRSYIHAVLARPHATGLLWNRRVRPLCDAPVGRAARCSRAARREQRRRGRHGNSGRLCQGLRCRGPCHPHRSWARLESAPRGFGCSIKLTR